MGTEGLAHTGTTTTTMTPVGFPLARYSHHAPREGRSLSTAGSASNGMDARTQSFQLNGGEGSKLPIEWRRGLSFQLNGGEGSASK